MRGFANYLYAAFANRWNLLFFVGGCIFAVLSGAGAALLPMLIGMEIAYIVGLGSNEKFQKYVDAQAAKSAREQSISKQAANAYEIIVNALGPEALERYERLRQRCLELRQINAAIKNPTGPVSSLEEMQRADLDRLLWTFLKLLYTEHNLECFLNRSPEIELTRKIKQLESRKGVQDERAKQAIDENLKICQERLKNYQKARNNLDIVRLEIDRLENKISSLGEIAISTQQESDVSGHVDQLASSILQTEQTMNDMNITELQSTEEPPNLLERAIRVRE